jgi:hypothetical protein
MRIDLSQIVIDNTIYPRGQVNEYHVDRLLAAMDAGARLPEIVIDAASKRLVDGRHRYEVYLRKGLKTIACIKKSYADESDLFADSIRLNVSHGLQLSQYNVRNAIIRLEQYGYTKEAISDVVRIPIERIEEIERGFASDADSGAPIALKGGLSHLAGEQLNKEQQETNRRYSGPKAVFFVKQISGLLANDMWPRTATFAAEMDTLCERWKAVRDSKAA